MKIFLTHFYVQVVLILITYPNCLKTFLKEDVCMYGIIVVIMSFKCADKNITNAITQNTVTKTRTIIKVHIKKYVCKYSFTLKMHLRMYMHRMKQNT